MGVDTPRTDGAVMIVECEGRSVGAVHADLARDLEREAVEARRKVNEARWGHSVQVEALRKQISQLTDDLVAAKRWEGSMSGKDFAKAAAVGLAVSIVAMLAVWALIVGVEWAIYFTERITP